MNFINEVNMMCRMRRISFFVSVVACLSCQNSTSAQIAADQRAAKVDFVPGDGRLAIVIDGVPVAVYTFASPRFSRPCFHDVRTTTGVQVTRPTPPIAGFDLLDHDTMHPGIWMSFGDVSGSDYWRNKALVKHVEFVERPRGAAGRGSFAVRNQYLDQSDSSKVVCHEIARYTFLIHPQSYLILCDATFRSDREFAFGDQEEMGLGIRIATALRVGASGRDELPPGVGTITNSEGGTNEKEVWGTAADWTSFGGSIAGQNVVITIFCHPDNFRPSWFHARDYGLLVANPFGRHAFGKGEKSRISVRPGDELRLRYGLLIHSMPAEEKPNFAQAYRDYLQAANK
jgi:hypothetical protein